MISTFQYTLRLTTLICFCAVLWHLLLQPVQGSLLWRPSACVEIVSEWSNWQIACLLGMSVGLLCATALALLLVPKLIMTWTTAVVFEYFLGNGFGRWQHLIEDANKMAVEISRRTLLIILQEGEIMALVATILCWLTLNKL